VSRAKDSLLIGFAVATGVLVITTLRQRAEIQRLTTALAHEPAVAGAPLALHSGSTRSFTVSSTDANAAQRGAGAADARPSVRQREAAERVSPRRVGVARLLENPEFVRALERQQYGKLDARFGRLFRELNLPPEELARFKGLLVEKESITLDVVTVNETMLDAPLSPTGLRTSIRAAQSRVEAAIESLLGPERYPAYREYERTLPERATVAQLEQRLTYTDTPLAPNQADALVQILAAHAPPAANEAPPTVSVLMRAGVPEAVPLLPANAATGRVSDEVLVQSQAVLAPPQLDALRELQEEQKAAVKAAELIRQATPNDWLLPGSTMFWLQ
jgi:hypothetical protein